FRLSYEHRSESIPAATEIIRQRSGVRRSHPDVGSYSNNYKKAWSINVPRNYSVFIRFTKFDTESGCDYLRIYAGIVPEYQHTALQAISGNHSHPSYTFSHSVTLVFTTDGSSVREGFEFEFNVLDPVSLGISLIKPELWSLSDGLIRFRAVSQAECRRVRHRCELRLFNGSAVTAAQMKRCVSRVQTDFAVVAELIDTVNSTILCYKQAGTVNYSLPLFEKFNGDSQILLESLRVLQCAFCLQQLQASEADSIEFSELPPGCLEAHRTSVLQLGDVAVLGVRSAIRRSGFHCEMPPAQRQLCASHASRTGFWRDEAGGSLGAATASSFINYGCSRHHCTGSSGGLLCADEIWSAATLERIAGCPDDSTGVYVT
uniref:CUB domain-containing protein n=1 Tax=Macrostomum lignano TaxID=282301 RepID=A0A1I8HLB7_9PLAT